MYETRADRRRISAVVREYLPELSADDAREHLEAKLHADLIDIRRMETVEDDWPPPAAYDPEHDVDGKLWDFFAHHAGAWAGAVRRVALSSPAVAPQNRLVRDFVASQVNTVSALMMRTLLGELYRRRSCGELTGGTAEERYRNFREWTNSSAGYAELTARYSALFHMVRARVSSAADYVASIIQEIERNRQGLEEELRSLGPASQVVSISLHGDTHQNGKCVARITFSDGCRIVYKPRDMHSEAGYHRFVEWLNDQAGTRLRTLSVLPTGEGGFAEFVPTEEFSGDAEEYFAQIGQLAGVLYLLRATDIHHENMVTCGDGPVVVDAETLLTPRRRVEQPDAAPAAGQIAVEQFRESVAAVGLLPMVLKSGQRSKGMDIGAIGYDPGQRNPFKVLSLRNPGRDDMFAELADMEMAVTNANLSVGRAVNLPVSIQRDIVKREFRRVLDYARTHSAAVVAVIGECLGDARFRYVPNATVLYAQLLRMATHPDAVTDPVIRAAVLSRVILLAGGSYEISDEESRQLAVGDVPYFTYSARSCALAAGGRTILADAFREPALESVRTRIVSLDEQVIEHELRMIDLAFVSKLPLTAEVTGFDPAPRGRPLPRVGRDRFRSEAARVGDRLIATMVDGDDPQWPATWVAPQIIAPEDNQWFPGVLGTDIYGGSTGIALALAGLARVTGDSRYSDAAMRVTEPFEVQLRNGAMREVGLTGGGMGGVAGAVYATMTARRLLGTNGALSAGELTRELAELTEPGGRPAAVEADFVSGLAGVLAVCLALHNHTAGPSDRAIAEKATRTVAAAELAALGDIESVDGRVTAFTGYAHGAMGVGPVLMEYGAVFGDLRVHGLGSRIVQAALDAYDEQLRDWPRAWGGTQRSYAWCHGAPGMLLGCLVAVRHAPSLVPENRLARLVELTVDHGFGNNPSYCHGDLGSTEILLLAEKQLPGQIPKRVVRGLEKRLFVDVVERYDQRADTKHAYSNSLMVGQAGMVWSILRYLAPDDFPSVLHFE